MESRCQGSLSSPTPQGENWGMGEREGASPSWESVEQIAVLVGLTALDSRAVPLVDANEYMFSWHYSV